jgi:uncharacterized protein
MNVDYPLGFSGLGRTRECSHDEHLRDLIEQVLFTSPGERVMRPDFGAGLRALVFEPMSTTTLSLVQHQVERALIEWEPRIDLQAVRVTDDDRARGRLTVEIDYRVRATNAFYNLVYPFYLIQGSPT